MMVIAEAKINSAKNGIHKKSCMVRAHYLA